MKALSLWRPWHRWSLTEGKELRRGEECNGNEPMNFMQFSVEMSELFARKP